MARSVAGPASRPCADQPGEHAWQTSGRTLRVKVKLTGHSLTKACCPAIPDLSRLVEFMLAGLHAVKRLHGTAGHHSPMHTPTGHESKVAPRQVGMQVHRAGVQVAHACR